MIITQGLALIQIKWKIHWKASTRGMMRSANSRALYPNLRLTFARFTTIYVDDVTSITMNRALECWASWLANFLDIVKIHIGICDHRVILIINLANEITLGGSSSSWVSYGDRLALWPSSARNLASINANCETLRKLSV